MCALHRACATAIASPRTHCCFVRPHTLSPRDPPTRTHTRTAASWCDGTRDCFPWRACALLPGVKNPGFMLGSCPKACDQCGAAGMVKVQSWARGLALAGGETPPTMRGADGPARIAASDGIDLSKANTASERTWRAMASRRLRGAAKVAGMATRDAGDGAAGAKAAKAAPVPVLDGKTLRPALASLNATLPTLQRMRAELDEAAAKAAHAAHATHEAHEAPDEAPAHAESGGSLTTLRWQMYVGWMAILALCGLMVGRKFFRRAKGKPGAPKRGV
jgi:hypothetical protein